MLRRLSQHERLQLLLGEYEPIIRAAFIETIADIRLKVTMRLLIERLELRDIGGAFEVLHIEREAFGPLETAVARAYEGGGTAMAEDLRLRDPDGHRVVFRFGVRNPAAEQWLHEHSAQMVTRIVEDQRTAIRQALADGLARGENPRASALDIVGRVNRVTGRREGGVIGLTTPQGRSIASARAELGSGDPDKLRHYLTRERRDKRFDAIVKRAASAGRPVAPEDVTRMVGRYSERLLALRGAMLARTETMMALGQSRNEAIRQAIASGKVSADLVTKHWRSAGDNRVRHTHRMLNGASVGFGEHFVSQSGARLRYPGDPEAPISETSGCRCSVEYKVDYTGQLIRRTMS